MNTFKKNGGFTLVELIIVIAILAILSTGAIAGYSTYIKSANDAAVEAVLSDISTSAVLANAEAGAIDSITVAADTEDATKIKITVTAHLGTNFKTNFETSLNGTETGTLTEGTNGAADTYVIVIKEPNAWDASSYSGKTATWSAAGWSDPA